MSREQRIGQAALALLCAFWVGEVLLSSYVRFQHRPLLETIRSGGQAKIMEEDLARAIGDYQTTIDMMRCQGKLASELTLLRAIDADRVLTSPTLEGADESLVAMQTALGTQLACSPNDGKAWLDYAVVTATREGLSKQAQAAYRMSQHVAPKESWLVEKRLSFALSFLAMLDERSREAARADIAVLAYAHPNHTTRVLARAGVENTKELEALFTAAKS